MKNEKNEEKKFEKPENSDQEFKPTKLFNITSQLYIWRVRVAFNC